MGSLVFIPEYLWHVHQILWGSEGTAALATLVSSQGFPSLCSWSGTSLRDGTEWVLALGVHGLEYSHPTLDTPNLCNQGQCGKDGVCLPRESHKENCGCCVALALGEARCRIPGRSNSPTEKSTGRGAEAFCPQSASTYQACEQALSPAPPPASVKSSNSWAIETGCLSLCLAGWSHWGLQ